MNTFLEDSLFQHSIGDLAQGIYSLRRQEIPAIIRPHFREVKVNQYATRSGVGGEAYDGYRIGCVSQCADVVFVGTRDGRPAVPMIYRTRPPFGKQWWIMVSKNYV